MAERQNVNPSQGAPVSSPSSPSHTEVAEAPKE
jgi:hypothetical protein